MFFYVFVLQAYIDTLSADAEDSSYDSDDDADDVHEQVSRTSSDTLGQEFAEYVSQPAGGGGTVLGQQQPQIQQVNPKLFVPVFLKEI